MREATRCVRRECGESRDDQECGFSSSRVYGCDLCVSCGDNDIFFLFDCTHETCVFFSRLRSVYSIQRRSVAMIYTLRYVGTTYDYEVVDSSPSNPREQTDPSSRTSPR
jgi:hypothetical protein